ncbi:type 1 glutamine amidotransferase [Paraflavitalea sp. CAU 1676]|uniref:type 1 glutamine amidotransferase n=1 Tax=Paraflavitalea sp. CAU 1676 TaxID=3032598 RepID=UPI0023DAC11C|nr:type 1 glutamine amidotransferase [Paraflavitalea sp. CAU 1676]MDF2187378.1 type 1 glutamine amidotransferase [Paraflavitalea sp. CAU 1676]
MRIHFIQHVHFETPGYLWEWAISQQHTTTFTKIYEAVKFPAINTIDLLVVMGGPMGVYEEEKHPWLKEEKAFIRSAIDAGVKVLGICLGAQLIAEVAGARVYPNKEKEIGWWPVRKVTNDKTLSMLASFPDEFVTFHWHGDTFDLPAGAKHLFATEICPNQGFLINDRVAGLQFHFEATPALVDQMVTHGADELISGPYIQQGDLIKLHAPHYDDNQQELLVKFIEGFVNL